MGTAISRFVVKRIIVPSFGEGRVMSAQDEEGDQVDAAKRTPHTPGEMTFRLPTDDTLLIRLVGSWKLQAGNQRRPRCCSNSRRIQPSAS
jgi:hypothetical protein